MNINSITIWIYIQYICEYIFIFIYIYLIYKNIIYIIYIYIIYIYLYYIMRISIYAAIYEFEYHQNQYINMNIWYSYWIEYDIHIDICAKKKKRRGMLVHCPRDPEMLISASATQFWRKYTPPPPPICFLAAGEAGHSGGWIKKKV